MDVLLSIVFGVVGMMFVAGVGAMMLMFAFIQFTARLAIWLDVGKAYRERQELALRVIGLERSLAVFAEDKQPGRDDNEPLVKAVKFEDAGQDK